MNDKEQLINDIETLLNAYGDGAPTHINPDLLAFMDEETLKSIIGSLLKQKENAVSQIWSGWNSLKSMIRRKSDGSEEPSVDYASLESLLLIFL